MKTEQIQMVLSWFRWKIRIQLNQRCKKAKNSAQIPTKPKKKRLEEWKKELWRDCMQNKREYHMLCRFDLISGAFFSISFTRLNRKLKTHSKEL